MSEKSHFCWNELFKLLISRDFAHSLTIFYLSPMVKVSLKIN
jgi:hypothetical protein